MTEAVAAAAVDFDLDAQADEQLPPSCTFRLGGKVWRVKHSDNIDFAIISRALTDQVNIIAFFDGVLVLADVAAFVAMLNDPPDGMTLGRVRGAARLVAEKVLGFPTTASSSSSPAPAATPPKRKSSRARSSSPATHRRASGE